MLILDTHTLLWFLRDSSELPSETKNMIQQADVVGVSIASLWEIAIKMSLGKLELEILQTLPKIHGDPFDRLIICQTIQSSAILITKDTFIPKYPVRTCWK